MNAFIIQTIALSLGVFLLGLFLGWLLKKLFCKNKSKVNAYGLNDHDRSEPSFTRGAEARAETAKAEYKATNRSVAAKAAGATAAVAGAAAIAKTMSDSSAENKIESIGADINTPDVDIDSLKEQAIDKVKNALPDADSLTDNISGKLEDIQTAISDKADSLIDSTKESTGDITESVTSAVNIDMPEVDGAIDNLKDKAESISVLGEQAVDKVKDALPGGDTLTDNISGKLEDIQTTVSEKTEGLVDSAKESISSVSENITTEMDIKAPTDGLNLDTAKTAIATAAGAVVAATAGASILSDDNSSSNTDINNPDMNNSVASLEEKAGKDKSRQASKSNINYTAADTIHRTIRRRHRSCRCRR